MLNAQTQHFFLFGVPKKCKCGKTEGGLVSRESYIYDFNSIKRWISYKYTNMKHVFVALKSFLGEGISNMLLISNIFRDIFRISHCVSTTLHITHNCNLIEVWLIQIFLCRSKKKYKCAILKDSDEKIDKCACSFYMRARYGILIINFFRPKHREPLIWPKSKHHLSTSLSLTQSHTTHKFCSCELFQFSNMISVFCS